MKKSRFTESQIVSILKQAEAGTPVADLCREYGMSSASFYHETAQPFRQEWLYFGAPLSFNSDTSFP